MDQLIDQEKELEIKKQHMLAAAFFFQKTDQYIASERSKLVKVQNSVRFLYNFHKLVPLTTKGLPPCLQKHISTKYSNSPHRKELERVQVFVQLIPCAEFSSCISIDKINNSLTLTDPTPSRKFTASNAPKSFQVDTIFNADWPLAEICSNILNNVVRSVANGEDACVLSFGNVSSIEHNVMLGTDKSSSTSGIIPCAIMWLFNFLNLIRQNENSRFSVRISATEVSEKQEICRDLLAKASNTISNCTTSASFSPLNTPVELRAVDTEKAFLYLDYALSERSKSECYGLSHMLLTLHVYQYHMQNDTGISGGRSRLHLIDLGHGRLSESNESNALSIQGISKVILGLLSGQRHIPNSESYLTQLLRKVLMKGSGNIQTSILFNISGKEVQYNEALQVAQLASKIFRQKLKSSKLSTSIISDDNSSSDSFSLRRMSKTKERDGKSRRSDVANISSDLDAASSSDVSCDTVIFRGQRSDRGSADRSSQEMIKNVQLNLEEKKTDIKLSLFQLKRRSSTKIVSNAWPKVAFKNASQVMKSGQELWVDGPQAFCSEFVNNEKTEIRELKSGGQELLNISSNVHKNYLINADNCESILKNQSKMNNKETSANRYDYLARSKNIIEQYGNDSVLKSIMIKDWLSKQPELSEETDIDVIYSKISRKTIGNKMDNEIAYINEKVNQANCFHLNKVTQIEQPKAQIESSERKISSKNHSRIEEWIKSVESPRIKSYLNEISLPTSSTCSPYPTNYDPRAFFEFSAYGVSSVPLSYNPHSCGSNDIAEGTSIQHHLISSEIDEEMSKLWAYDKVINNSHAIPFDDTSLLSSSFSYGFPMSINRIDPLRKSCHKSPPSFSRNNEIPNSPQEILVNQAFKKTNKLQKYSTLPLDTYSPKHSKDKNKTKVLDNYEKSNGENTLKQNNESKKNHKDFKKKETKKGFNFFNQLIRNKKTKKEISINKVRKEDSAYKYENGTNEQKIKLKDVHLSDSVDYNRQVGTPPLLSSPYHLLTSTKTIDTGDSSGHGSDCSSVNGIKAAQVSVNLHPETSGFRFTDVHRAGSSGYESVVRDSELSSHNDSASECSAPNNVSVQSPTLHKDVVHMSISLISTPFTSTLSQSLLKHKQKPDFPLRFQECQKVEELIRNEKLSLLQTEREEILTDLINTMKYYNIDSEASKKELEKQIIDMDGIDKCYETIKSTNQSLRSVLNRYQSNIYIITSFLSKPSLEYFCD